MTDGEDVKTMEMLVLCFGNCVVCNCMLERFDNSFILCQMCQLRVEALERKLYARNQIDRR
jgi:hypothetical protein